MHPNPSSEDLQKQLNTFIGLHKSLHQKTKYYIPSCEKVLEVIDSGISQQKRSLNGEILRSHADMKLRWRNLQERMSRTETEMLGVQELLSDLSAKVTRADQQAISDGITSSSASTSSHKSSASTPSRSSVTTARNKVGDWLSPSPSRQSGDGKASEPVDSPLHSRSITPFRRLANRLQRSKTSEGVSPPTVHVPVPVPSVSSSSRASHSPESQRTPLPKEKVGLGHPTPTQSAPSMPRTASSPATVDRQQRRYSKMPIAGPSSTPDVPPPRPSYLSSAKSERARSPIPPPRSSSSIGTAVSERPPWNAGTRLPQDSFLGASLPASTAAKGRKSLPGGTIRNPTARYSHLPSGYSQARPQSRIFTTPSASFRAPSPTFSATSNTSASASRLRPSSPNSRIPAPGSSGDMPRRDGRNVHHGSPNGGEDVETLYFGARNEEGGDSLMQRALSPTLSQSGFSVTSSTGGGTPGGNRRHSRIPRLSLGDAQLPDPQMLNIPPPPKIPAVYAGRSEIMTPEPTLRSKAARVSAMYGRPSMSARKSLGHGSMPPLSSEFTASPQPQRSLTASTSGMRPSSRLSVGTGVGGGGRRSSFYAPSTSSRLATPLPDVPGGSLYYPNKHDPLDSEIAEIVNSQPLYVSCQREDPQLSKAAAEAQAPSDRMAKYWLAHNDKPILCKLIDRGDRKPKKVLCKIAGGTSFSSYRRSFNSLMQISVLQNGKICHCICLISKRSISSIFFLGIYVCYVSSVAIDKALNVFLQTFGVAEHKNDDRLKLHQFTPCRVHNILDDNTARDVYLYPPRLL